jgi:hypothetical protein
MLTSGVVMFPAVYSIPQVTRCSRVLLLFRPVLVAPLLLWSLAYGIYARLLMFFAWWSILITGRHPRFLWERIDSHVRFSARLRAYTIGLTDVYPPFKCSPGSLHSIRVHHEYPARMSRLNVLFRLLLLLPHICFAAVYGLGVFVAALGSLPVVLVLGRQPLFVHAMLSSWFIYEERVGAYSFMLIDEYPPFHGLQPKAVETVFTHSNQAQRRG